MKKILSILLSFALVICMLPASAVTAFADTISLKDDMITLSPASGTYTGATIATPTVTVKGATAADFEVQCDPIKNAGDYIITVSAKAGSTVLSGSAKATFTVAPRDLGTAGVNIVEKSNKYLTAEQLNPIEGITPTEYFEVQYNGVNITEDCALYIEKGGTNSISVAIVTATAKTGNVTKMITRSFMIKTDLSGYKIIGSGKDGAIPDQTYNGGKELKPTVYVVPKGNTGGSTTGSLTENKDYDLRRQY